MKTIFTFIISLCFLSNYAQTDLPDWINGYPDGCTTITAGKKATSDGSVYTSHTDDSHRTRSEINIAAAANHPKGSMKSMFKRIPCDSFAMPSYCYIKVGEIPEVAYTYQYINSAYPCMNMHQLAIGESTFGGRKSLHSDKGIIDCQQLVQLMLERCTTARAAILLADSLTKTYGWNDEGECLTIADKNEVWHFEILGPGKANLGAIWAAQRVPDDEVGVNANASTIKEIDLSKPDFFMASKNIYKMASDSGWWNPQTEVFRFCYAYAPESRTSIASRRREWRVFDLIAPSRKFDANAENYPFSVKPDLPLTLDKMVSLFKDYYEGTPYDMCKDITVTNDSGKTIISPLANPFMPYDMNKMLRINGGWGWMGERTIARWYTMYGTIIQCRNWLPDEIGGLAWLAFDNIATSIYVPVYAGSTDLPLSYKTPGRTKGYTNASAWWAFNRLGTLTAQRWGDMRKDVDAVWNPMQKELFASQKKFEEDALAVFNSKNKSNTTLILTRYTMSWGEKVVKKAWDLGDFLWTKYDEKF